MTPNDDDSFATRKVRFIVSRPGDDLDGLIADVGSPPDSAHAGGHGRTANWVAWELVAEGSGTTDTTSLVSDVLRRVRAIEGQIVGACSAHRTTCQLKIVQYVANDLVGPGFYIDADDLAMLVRLNARLDVDQYYAGPDVDE